MLKIIYTHQRIRIFFFMLYTHYTWISITIISRILKTKRTKISANLCNGTSLPARVNWSRERVCDVTSRRASSIIAFWHTSSRAKIRIWMLASSERVNLRVGIFFSHRSSKVARREIRASRISETHGFFVTRNAHCVLSYISDLTSRKASKNYRKPVWQWDFYSGSTKNVIKQLD